MKPARPRMGRRDALGLLAAAIAPGCAAVTEAQAPVVEIPEAPEAPPHADKPWHVGAFIDLTGNDPQYGLWQKEGVELAAEEIKAQGGLLGQDLKLFYGDDRGQNDVAVEQVRGLIERDHVVAVLGGSISEMAKQVGQLTTQKGVPLVVAGATHPDVTRVGPFVFRLCVDDRAQGRAAARLLVKELGKKRFGLLHHDYAGYSMTLAGVFREEAPKLGGAIVVEQTFRNAYELPRVLGEIGKARPDFVYAPIFGNEMAFLASHLAEAGLRGDQFVGGDGWPGGELLLGDAGKLLEGARYSGHWVPRPEAQAFIDTYTKRWGHEPSQAAALGYDALMLIADAIRRAKEPTPWAVRDAILATRDFTGVTGRLSMGEDREPRRDVHFARITGGRVVLDRDVPGEAR